MTHKIDITAHFTDDNQARKAVNLIKQQGAAYHISIKTYPIHDNSNSHYDQQTIRGGVGTFHLPYLGTTNTIGPLVNKPLPDQEKLAQDREYYPGNSVQVRVKTSGKYYNDVVAILNNNGAYRVEVS